MNQSKEGQQNRKSILKTSNKYANSLKNDDSLCGRSMSHESLNKSQAPQEENKSNKSILQINEMIISDKSRVSSSRSSKKGTLKDLNLEDKRKVGSLMQKLVEERQEKERLLKILNKNKISYQEKLAAQEEEKQNILQTTKALKDKLQQSVILLKLQKDITPKSKRQDESNKSKTPLDQLEPFRSESLSPFDFNSSQDLTTKQFVEEVFKQPQNSQNSQRPNQEFKLKDCSPYSQNKESKGNEDFFNDFSPNYEQKYESQQIIKPNRVILQKKLGESEDTFYKWKQQYASQADNDVILKQSHFNQLFYEKALLLTGNNDFEPYQEVKQIRSQMESLLLSFNQIKQNGCISQQQNKLSKPQQISTLSNILPITQKSGLSQRISLHQDLKKDQKQGNERQRNSSNSGSSSDEENEEVEIAKIQKLFESKKTNLKQKSLYDQSRYQ